MEIRIKRNVKDYDEFTLYYNDEILSSVIINGQYVSADIFKRILKLKNDKHERTIIIKSENFKLDNNKAYFKKNYGVDDMKDNLIINAKVHSSKIIEDNLFTKKTKFDVSFPYEIDGKKKIFKLKYIKYSDSSSRASWMNIFDEINKELTNLKMKKLKVNSLNDFKKLEKLIYNEKIRKTISRTKRKEKLTNLLKDD